MNICGIIREIEIEIQIEIDREKDIQNINLCKIIYTQQYQLLSVKNQFRILLSVGLIILEYGGSHGVGGNLQDSSSNCNNIGI